MTFEVCTLALLVAGSQALEKDAPPNPPKPPADSPEVVRVARQAARPPHRALAYSFVVDPTDQIPGNAAQTWIRAGLAARGVAFKWTDKEDAWRGPGEGGTPLDKLPLARVKGVLDKYGTALRAAERAALQSRCHWEYPPLTIQSLGDLSFDDVQMLRELTRLICLRCRVAQAEGRYDDAARDLRVGLTLARQSGNSQILIQDLVAIAIAAINLGRVEEWVQTPGSPNLYWALTELPSPLIDVRHSVKYELGTLYRSFPELRRLRQSKLAADEANALINRFFVTMSRLADESGPAWKIKLGVNVLGLKYHEAAKKHLVGRGMAEKDVEKLSVTHAWLLYILDENDRIRDEFVRAISLPPPQGHAEMDKVEKVEMPRAKANGNLAVALLMPAMGKVYHAQLRLDRNIAGLRAVEAVRLHIAKHGAPPRSLADVKEVPLPIDPITGKGFETWYSVQGDKAVLDVPPPPGQSARQGKRYEFPMQAR